MRIGELSLRTGVPARLLRYYEQQGLLEPARGSNGYRDYAKADVARATQVATIVRSGLPGPRSGVISCAASPSSTVSLRTNERSVRARLGSPLAGTSGTSPWWAMKLPGLGKVMVGSLVPKDHVRVDGLAQLRR